MASEDEKKNLTRTFKALDTNGDGVLSKEEIRKGYKKTMGITSAELDALLEQVDSNHNAAINYSEFMVASLNRRELLTDARIDACFQLFDKVNSPILSKVFNFFRTIQDQLPSLNSRKCLEETM